MCYPRNLLLEPLFTCSWEGRAGLGGQGKTTEFQSLLFALEHMGGYIPRIS